MNLKSRLVQLFVSRPGLEIVLLFVAAGGFVAGWGSIPELQAGRTTEILISTAFGGLLLSWLLATLHLRAWLCMIVLTLWGPTWVILRAGQLFEPLVNWFRRILELFVQLWRVGFHFDWLPVQSAWLVVAERTDKTVAPLAQWLSQARAGQFTADPAAMTLVWSTLLWLSVAWAGWATRRYRKPLVGIFPGAALMAGAFNYRGIQPYALLPVVGAALLLMALLHYDTNERRWNELGVDFAEGVGIDLAIVNVFLVGVLLAAAAFAPALSIQSLVEFSRKFTQGPVNASDQVAQALGLQPAPASNDSADPLRLGGLPREHLLGGRPDLTRKVVMKVRVIEPEYTSPIPPELAYRLGAISVPAPRYYWRMLTYDRYTGSGWLSSQTETRAYASNQTLFPDVPAHQQIIRQSVQAVGVPTDLLLVTGVLLQADVDYRVAWRTPPSGDAQAKIDFDQVDIFGTLTQARDYQAESALPKVSVSELREAPAQYPAWIAERYLQLPDELPVRVRELAYGLVAGQPTPYDQARAIEVTLRRFPYTLDVPIPPRGRDVADYFLFDLQAGYCDYYATAMVVLARVAGLPARIVSGYAGGAYDFHSEEYVVTEADAHSWVEIYFSGIGWVEFEPTAGQPEIVRPQNAEQESPSAQELPSTAAKTTSNWLRNIRAAAILGLVGLILLGAVAIQGAFLFQMIEHWWWMHTPPEQAIPKIYRRFYAAGQKVVGTRRGETPLEFTDRLGCRFVTLGGRKHLGRRFVPGIAEIQFLTSLYTRTIYSSHLPTAEQRLAAVKTWRKLRNRLWLARFFKGEHTPV